MLLLKKITFTLIFALCYSHVVSAQSIGENGGCVEWGGGAKKFNDGTFSVRNIGARFNGMDSAEVVDIQSDKITISPYYRDGRIYTGSVTTRGKLEMLEGTIEVKADICTEAPVRSSIWLQSSQNNDAAGRIGAGTEIDLVEAIGDVASQNIHFGGYQALHTTRGARLRQFKNCAISTFSSSFNSSGLTFKVNGLQTWNDTRAHTDASEFLILSSEYDARSSRRILSGAERKLGKFEITGVRFCGKHK